MAVGQCAVPVLYCNVQHRSVLYLYFRYCTTQQCTLLLLQVMHYTVVHCTCSVLGNKKNGQNTEILIYAIYSVFKNRPDFQKVDFFARLKFHFKMSQNTPKNYKKDQKNVKPWKIVHFLLTKPEFALTRGRTF